MTPVSVGSPFGVDRSNEADAKGTPELVLQTPRIIEDACGE